ncbi:hypothetical protein AXF42_Ash014427 [Apostasia shenzhenica]|uniref:Protein AATF n=1 Tax=Apostasia shenzhenica TaxID=1088818 RepID=A0A2H9ZWG9_9ASPA|nr:hypothetical protein AXF42_Ash014427 [Apostasia shenzhenica]
MGSAFKHFKGVQNERENSLEADSDQENPINLNGVTEMETELASDQSKLNGGSESGSELEVVDAEQTDLDGVDEEVGDVYRLGKQKDVEMEGLEKEYHNLRSEEQDLLKNLKRHKDEDAIKGQAVKNQKALWDKTLEFRFLLQKSFSSSNKLPQEPARSYFCNSDTTVDQAYSDLISSTKKTLGCMLELQEILLGNNTSITQGSSTESCKDEYLSATLNSDTDEDWLKTYKLHCRITPFRNSSIDKWHRKTQVTTGAAAFRHKLNAFNQNVSDQVAGYMRDPNRMIKRMQLRRSSVDVYGSVPEECQHAREEDNGDPELLDDSEFYQQLLKEFFESCDSTPTEAAFYALKKLQPKKRKLVDRRASKSRKIR